MKTLITALLVFSSPQLACSEKVINDFLMAAEENVNYFKPSGLSEQEMGAFTTWIEDAQFRVKTITDNNFSFNNHDESYEIRIQPKAWGQRDLENNLLKLQLAQYNNRYTQLLTSALTKRYFVIMDYLEQQYKTRYQIKLSSLLEQESQLLSSQVTSSSFNAKKLLETQEMLEHSKDMLVLYMKRLNATRKLLGLPQVYSDNLQSLSDTDWVIKVSEIDRFLLLAEKTDLDESAPAVVDAKTRLKMIQTENQLLKTKQQLGVDLLRFEYKDSKNDEMAFQLGVNIPLGSSYNGIKSYRKLSMEQSQLENKTRELRQTLVQIRQEIDWLSQELRLMQASSERIRKRLRQKSIGSDPFLTISLQKQLFADQIKYFERKKNLLKHYVSYLATSGKLTEQPLRNWIQSGTPHLIPR